MLNSCPANGNIHRLLIAFANVDCLMHWDILRLYEEIIGNICMLTLKAPITTEADDKFCDIFPNFRKNQGIRFHENRLPADFSHKIPYLLFLKKSSKI